MGVTNVFLGFFFYTQCVEEHKNINNTVVRILRFWSLDNWLLLSDCF